MSEPFSLTDAVVQPTVEAELWGVIFDVPVASRSRLKAVEALQRELDDLDPAKVDDEADAAVDLMARMVDVMLVPQKGKRKKASAYIVEKWRADEIAFGSLEVLLDRLGDLARPT